MTGIFLLSVALAGSGMQPAAAPVSAQATQTTQARATQARPSRDDRVICRRQEEVGTRLGTRTCLTRAQWRSREAEARHNAHELMDESGRVGGVAPPTPGGGPR